MTHKITRISAALLASTIAGAAFAEEVTIVLSEELENVEPCMASKSNIGRVC
jgi:peptide/nickel transport system substrate-binding protein